MPGRKRREGQTYRAWTWEILHAAGPMLIGELADMMNTDTKTAYKRCRDLRDQGLLVQSGTQMHMLYEAVGECPKRDGRTARRPDDLHVARDIAVMHNSRREGTPSELPSLTWDSLLR